MNINWKIGRKLIAVFITLFLIQIVVALIAYNGIHRSDLNNGQVIHTYEVLESLDSIIHELGNAETGQRGYIITGDESYLEPYNSALPLIDQAVETTRSLTADNPNQQDRLDKLEPLISSKLAELKQTIDLRKKEGFEAARVVVLTNRGKQDMDNIRSIISDAILEEQGLMVTRNTSAAASSLFVTWAILVGSLISMLFIIGAAIFLSRSIVNPLTSITKIAEQIGGGDLTVTLPEEQRRDEIGALNGAFRQMLATLKKSTSDLSEAVGLLGSSASEILAATTQVASGTAEAAASISETTTTVEEVRQAAQLSSQKAQSVSDSAQRVAQVTQSGQKAVAETSAGMDRIREQMETIAQTVVRLSEQSQSIGGIIASVTDLADQSNLLAVNAAIEAAKAGEQGRGFAVVAQEIKNLAEQSKQATQQVRGILSDVQKATSNAVMATEQGSKAVEAGVRQAAQAGEAIRLLAESSSAAVQIAIQIVASSQQQVVGMNQIGVAMENINQAGAQTAASMRQMEVAAQNLHELGEKLKELVAQFKVS